MRSSTCSIVSTRIVVRHANGRGNVLGGPFEGLAHAALKKSSQPSHLLGDAMFGSGYGEGCVATAVSKEFTKIHS
jgi:hypothetical protein